MKMDIAEPFALKQRAVAVRLTREEPSPLAVLTIFNVLKAEDGIKI
jgi:hypothetical protein